LREQFLTQTLTARHWEAATGLQTETLGAEPIGDRSFKEQLLSLPTPAGPQGHRAQGTEGSAGVHRVTHTGIIRLPTAICTGEGGRGSQIEQKSWEDSNWPMGFHTWEEEGARDGGTRVR